MYWEDFDQQRRFHEAWSAVQIVRPVYYSLFTFGQSILPYYLVCGAPDAGPPVSVTRGEVHVKRPVIITRADAPPEFHNFFENPDEEGVAQFLIARTARFANLQFDNQSGAKQILHEGVEAAIAKLNRKLDDDEEDRVAILSAPPNLGGVAVLRYTAERVLRSVPDNIQELKERGFLP
jgi:hypothetical protein